MGIKSPLCNVLVVYQLYQRSSKFCRKPSGGIDTKDWGHEKNEDEIEWIRRYLQQATKMVKPRKDKGLSR